MKTFYVYLSGPMDGLTGDDARGWRKWAIEYFELYPELGIKCIDPCRDIVCNEDGIITDINSKALTVDGISISKATRDKIDILCCDAMLINLSVPDRPYFGTTREIDVALVNKKATFAFYRQHKPAAEHCWLMPDCLDALVPSLSEAISLIVEWVAEQRQKMEG
jgi:hypothetical protein